MSGLPILPAFILTPTLNPLSEAERTQVFSLLTLSPQGGEVAAKGLADAAGSGVEQPSSSLLTLGAGGCSVAGCNLEPGSNLLLSGPQLLVLHLPPTPASHPHPNTHSTRALAPWAERLTPPEGSTPLPGETESWRELDQLRALGSRRGGEFSCPGQEPLPWVHLACHARAHTGTEPRHPGS